LLRIGVDIGGTFTDLVVLDATGRIVTRKVPSSPDDHSRAILDGLRELLSEGLIETGAVREVVHGTTIATNTIVELRGARTALLTTRGFRDTLEIGRLRYPRLYDLTWSKPLPLVPRHLRLEVPERLDRDGHVVLALDEPAARAAIARLRDAGAEAIAVCLLHSFVNPVHELRLGELIAQDAPDIAVALSCAVLPEIGEFERTSTTVIYAYVQPVVGGYLRRLEDGLAALGVAAPVLVMQSSGGVMSARAAGERPIHIVESGPAAGVIAAQHIARALDSANVITLDMGGTTAKAAILEGGEPNFVSEYEVGGGLNIGNRLNRGAGYLLRAPAIDIAEVGAGGGSIVWLDPARAIHVGPRSAGAVPGPVCYRAGGTQPTLTDANLLLGYLNQDALLGGTLAIDRDYARQVFESAIAAPLGLGVDEAAYGVHRIGAANMVRVVRAVSSERGRDPRGFGLVAFGGNGPVHAALVAAELSMRRVIVPPAPGLFSAFGLLGAELTHHFSRTVLRPTHAVRPDDLEHAFGELEQAARTTLAAEGFSDGACHLQRSVDARYVGQSFELRLPLEADPFTEQRLRAVEARFGAEHQRTYGHRADDDPIELVNLRVAATGRGDSPRSVTAAYTLSESNGTATSRPAYFGPQHGWLETPIIARSELDSTPRRGPLIVEEYDATTIVPPGCAAWRDAAHNIVLEVDLPA
jgi:N-methylhydantoinase A